MWGREKVPAGTRSGAGCDGDWVAAITESEDDLFRTGTRIQAQITKEAYIYKFLIYRVRDKKNNNNNNNPISIYPSK